MDVWETVGATGRGDGGSEEWVKMRSWFTSKKQQDADEGDVLPDYEMSCSYRAAADKGFV